MADPVDELARRRPKPMIKFLAPDLGALTICVPDRRLDNDIAEASAKAAVVAECIQSAREAGCYFDPDAPDVRAMSASKLSWTAYALKRAAIMSRQPVIYVDGI